MNPFTSDYIGNMVLADRKQVIEFKCPQNWGRGPNFVIAWLPGPYDVSTTYKTLTLRVAIDNDFRNWSTLSFDLSGGTYAATNAAATATEIATYLNGLTGFSSYFTATATDPPLFAENAPRLKIKQVFQETRMKFYVDNISFERLARFNARVGVAELPTYFDRHAIWTHSTSPAYLASSTNLTSWPYHADSTGSLVYLNTSNAEDQLVINSAVDAKGTFAGFAHGTIQTDWQLLTGRSGAFNCQIITLDVTNRVSVIIEFQTGAKAGDLARKIEYYYAVANATSSPNGVYETPYVLTPTQIDYLTNGTTGIK